MSSELELLNEKEKEILRKKLTEDEVNSFFGDDITFFFPPEENLDPVCFHGTVPRIDEVIVMENIKTTADERFDFNNRRHWKVEKVYRKYIVGENKIARIMYETTSRVEVILNRAGEL